MKKQNQQQRSLAFDVGRMAGLSDQERARVVTTLADVLQVAASARRNRQETANEKP